MVSVIGYQRSLGVLEICTDQEVISAIQLKNMAAASGCQGLGRMMAICKKSPLMGLLREKEGQHPVLEVYYSHMS